MDSHDILAQVTSLVDAEHELRDRVQAGEIPPEEEQARLQQLEGSLDQCWDLLRQRRARREFGQDPDEAAVRPVQQVEGYRQ